MRKPIVYFRWARRRSVDLTLALGLPVLTFFIYGRAAGWTWLP